MCLSFLCVVGVFLQGLFCFCFWEKLFNTSVAGDDNNNGRTKGKNVLSIYSRGFGLRR